MLGELIGEERGQVTTTRVLPSAGGYPRVEVSFQAEGHLLDADINDIGTYVAVARPDGTLSGEGQGIVMTTTGETITWKGTGVGRFTRPGAIAWRGSVYYETTAPKFQRLTSCAAVYEFETDEGGKTESKSFEWK
jgi:hypothetical protein